MIDPLAVAVGVPDKTPAELNVSPVGSVPAVTLQVIGAVPVAVKYVVGYSVSTVPVTRNAGEVIAGALALAHLILTFAEPGMS